MKTVTFKNKTITPSKIVCVGRNYVAHIEELGNQQPGQPVLFIKPNSSISDQLHFDNKDTIHYEGEISFLVENNQFAGVAFGLDLTKRERQAKLQASGLPWERAKAFDGAALFSEFVPFDGDVSNLSLKLFINEQLVQQGGVELMIFKPDFVLEDILNNFSLEDGDIIMTGTPAGAGAYSTGDNFSGQVFAGDTLLTAKSWTAE